MDKKFAIQSALSVAALPGQMDACFSSVALRGQKDKRVCCDGVRLDEAATRLQRGCSFHVAEASSH